MSRRSQATLVDRGYQVAYFVAYRAMRTYWKVRRPTTQGTLVALWNGGEVLLVRNSYVSFYSLPGGYMRRGEAPRDAAVRELAEEVGISLRPDELALSLDRTHDWEGKHDHVHIFTVDVPTRPEIGVDHREVIEASWWTPERALALDLFPPLREVIERRRATGAAPPKAST